MAKLAYLRVSAIDQNLARQEAMAEEWQVDKIFSEKKSGKDAERPALKEMLAYAREGDILHVESISRLARSTRDLLNIVDILNKKGVAFVSRKEALDTTTPAGRFMLTVFAALAELERESTALRREEGLAAAKKAGVKLGRPPVAVPKEFPAIVEEFKAGRLTAAVAAKRAGMSRTSFYRLVGAQ